jgi:formylglycine-generating enzyme required for sulfatase activity
VVVYKQRLDAHPDPAGYFAGLLRAHIQASLYSYGQLARLSGVPKRTIVNWLDGTVKQPRNWQSVLRVAAALRVSREQVDELLAAADLADLRSIASQLDDPEDLRLLKSWEVEPERSAVRQFEYLHRYLQAVINESKRLPAYFPLHTSFTVTELYQDLRLRRIESAPVTNPLHSPNLNEGERWSALRQQVHRAVILGLPGMGKTWLLKTEARSIAQEAMQSQPYSDPDMLPVLIRVPDLVTMLNANCGLSDILRVIATLAARMAPALSERELKAALFSYFERLPERVIFLLDALDEVPCRDGLRNLARRVVMLLGSGTQARVILASRTLGYGAAPLGRYLGSDVPEYELLPFNDREITRVMRAWFHGRTPLLQRLQVAIRRAPGLARQATNPLLLSLMCMLNETQGDELTGNVSGLYEAVLRLLLEGPWRNFDMQLPESRVRNKLRVLEAIAWRYATYRNTWWEQLPGDVIEDAIELLPEAQRLWSTWHSEWGMLYEGPLWELSEWDGILIKGYTPSAGAMSAVPYAFLHRTFQEFLVARYLLRRYGEAGLDAPEVQEFLTSKAGDPEWYIVLLLLVEQLTSKRLPDAQALLDQLTAILLDAVQDRTGQMAVAAVEVLLNLQATGGATEVVQTLRDRLLAMVRNAEVKTVMRVHAARLLAELGDPRPEVMDVDAIQFVEVPAGEFLMGSNEALDPETSNDETPQHLCSTRRFFITRYPVSNAQFRQFANDAEDGYHNPEYWPEAIALGHWRDGLVWRMHPQYRADGNVDWEAKWVGAPHAPGWPADLPNAPIMGISWYEARAFIRWLEKRWRRSGKISPTTRLDLPSEAEWEKAARGVDGRIYPWGNELDENRLNCFSHLTMAPAPIGCFPNSTSPYGVEGMVGNLWEWTRSIYEPYGASYGCGTNFADVLAPDVNLVIRGGAYFSIRTRCRCAARSATLPNGRMNATFRIALYEGEAT